MGGFIVVFARKSPFKKAFSKAKTGKPDGFSCSVLSKI
jgi:hypothetical protein